MKLTIQTKLVWAKEHNPIRAEHLKLLVQLIGLLAVLIGISAWSVPSAFIIGGLVLIAALEMQQPREDYSRDREFKNLMDQAVLAGKNPFTEAKIPMTQKWLSYAHLITRKL